MTNGFRIASAVVLLGLATACGGPAGSGPAPTLSVSPGARSVTAGSGAVSFTATLTGGTDPVTWGLSGPGALSATAGTTTSYTPPATIGATASATLTAAAGSLTATASITVNPAAGGITVNGTVRLDDGTPLAGAPVRVDPGGHAATTAADGTFSLPGVTPPYDLAAVDAARKVAVVYAGLTRADPAAVVPTRQPAPPLANGAVVSGTVESTTGCNAGTSPCQGEVALGSAVASSLGLVDPVTGTYALDVGWDGAASFQGTLHLLQASTDPIRGTTSYGYGAKTGVTVANGAVTVENWGPASVSPLPAATLSGTGTVAGGYAVVSASLSLGVAGASLPAASCSSTPGPAAPPCAPGAFSWDAPDVGGATLTVTVFAHGPSGEVVVARRSGGVARGTGFDYAIQAAPSLQAPAAGATGVTPATLFSWTPFAGGVHTAIFKPGVTTDPWYYVYTAGTSTTVPDLGAVSASVALPAGARYSWAVAGLAPATLDAWAGPGGPALANPFTVGDSPGRSFTTR